MTCVTGSEVDFNDFFQFKFTIIKSLQHTFLLQSHITAFNVAILHYDYMYQKDMKLHKTKLIHIHTCWGLVDDTLPTNCWRSNLWNRILFSTFVQIFLQHLSCLFSHYLQKLIQRYKLFLSMHKNTFLSKPICISSSQVMPNATQYVEENMWVVKIFVINFIILNNKMTFNYKKIGHLTAGMASVIVYLMTH